MIDPAQPVQLSGGILDTVELIEEVEPVLEELEDSILASAERASFNDRSDYEKIARESINSTDKIVPRTELFLHTYLGIQWANESLRQANQFGGLLQSDHNFNRHSMRAFPYIAHPPLIVAAIACSTMIEEVGATYVNAFVEGKSYDLDETSVGDVFSDIIEEYPDIDDFDATAISDHVIGARNDVSHYVTKRENIASIDDFEDFYVAVIEGMELVDGLLAELVQKPIEDFEQSLEKHYS